MPYIPTCPGIIATILGNFYGKNFYTTATSYKRSDYRIILPPCIDKANRQQNYTDRHILPH